MSEDLQDDAVTFTADETHRGARLDKVLSEQLAEFSRSRLQNLIKDGQVTLNGTVCTHSSQKLQAGDEIIIDVPPPEAAMPEAENIPLDVVYEDEDLIVLNKQAGLVVHPGAGNWSGTLVNALLYHCGDSLSGIGGVLRPGIVHRLDKDTSGLMVVAKNDQAHQGLSAQLQDRSLSRTYKTLVLKVPVPAMGMIDRPIGRHVRSRMKMDINLRNGREAKTFYKVIQNWGDACALVECKLESGRTHQIRVHMQSFKHPVLGDPLYGPQPNAVTSAFKKEGYDQKDIDAVLNFPRQALHAWRIEFIHPLNDEHMEFEAEIPADFAKLLKILGK